jgi:hypothetical protein
MSFKAVAMSEDTIATLGQIRSGKLPAPHRYDEDGHPVWKDARLLPYELAARWKACQSCRARGVPIGQLMDFARKAGLRRAGAVGWTRVVLCSECVTRARSAGYEVWEP